MPSYESVYPPAHSFTYVKSTTNANQLYAEYSTDPAKSLTGSKWSNSWLSTATHGEQRFHIDLGEAKVVKRIYYENFHDSGSDTNLGAKGFSFWGSNDGNSFAKLDYSIDTGWNALSITPNEFVQHPASDVADPRYILVTNDVAYRYYCVKVEVPWAGDYYPVGWRRIELQVETEEVTLPMLTIIAGADGVAQNIPMLTINGTFLTGGKHSGTGTIPLLSINAYTEGWGSDIAGEIPLLVAEGAGISGTISKANSLIPEFEISATLVNGTISNGVAIIPILEIDATMGNGLVVAADIPLLTLEAYAYGPMIGNFDGALPLLEITAYLENPGKGVRAYALNMKTNAFTEYDNYPFNSFCTFKGKHLAAGPQGIMLLEGNRDMSTDIKAYFNIGNNDFELPNIKRVTDAYLSLKGDGSYYLTVTSDDGTPHNYLLTAAAGARIKNIKANIGKGKKGRFFELELSNLNGSDFELFDMVLNVELLKRNI